MQNTVQNSKALRFGSGVLEVSSDAGNTWLNLGALKEGTLKYDFKISEIVFDNAKIPPKAKINEVLFSAKLAEVNVSNVYKLMSLGVLTSTPGTLVSPADEVQQLAGYVWKAKTMIKLLHSNGAGTVITPSAVKNNATTLTSGTDYEVVLINGETYLLNCSGSDITATGLGLRASYSYTPNEMVQILYSDVLQTLATNRFRFVNTDENGKKFGIEMYEGYNKAGFELAFRGDDDTENVMELPIELKAYPSGVNSNLFRIFDEQAVA